MSSTADRPDPLTARVAILGILALAALGWGVYEGWSLRQQSLLLETPLAPRGIVSLALAPTTASAQAILDEWQCGQRGTAIQEPRRCTIARQANARDYRFIAAYVLTLILIPIWARVTAHVLWKTTALVIAAVVVGGLLDVAENGLLESALSHTSSLEPARLFRLIRLTAMNTFVLLLLGGAGSVIVGFGALRKLLIERWLWKREREERAQAARTPAREIERLQPTPRDPNAGVDHLVDREAAGIFEAQSNRTGDTPVCAVNAAADEQYVSFREADLIGLALSGGGIRSATFNLGLLQELHCLRMLPLVDYLSTVSGGGYIGSFWSAWLMRLRARLGDRANAPDPREWDRQWNAELFPTIREPVPGQPHRVESDEERHLREFSGFLAPRWGFFEVETWTAIVALLAGLVPALLIGLSAIGITLIGWLALTFPLGSREADAAPALTIAIVSALVLWLYERMWQRFRRETSGRSAKGLPEHEARSAARGRKTYGAFAVGAVLLIAGLEYWLRTAYQMVPGGPWPIFMGGLAGAWHAAPDASGIVRWWAIAGIDNPEQEWIFSPRLFDFGVVWLVAGLVMIALRTTSAILPRPWRRESLAAFDRVLMRTLGMGAAWIGLAVLWHVSINLKSLVTVAISAAISGAIFAALRNWIGLALRRPSEAGILDRLKPALPALLAYLTLILTAIAVGAVLVETAGVDWFAWWTASAVMTGLLVIGMFITPDEFGMHAFYRDRIARAYAGATNLDAKQGATDNRGTEPRDGDDPKFTELVPRPLHLVCCAANDLSGDQVETLNRGARSAVLSKYGFSIGRYAREWHELSPANRLGSGVTASAAAFNSNMGQISVRVGPAVSFLMTMLNLRLGLWVRHPLASTAGPRRWPGLLYYREMLGLTSSSGRLSPEEVPKSVLRDIHLSDGGHFENLALYELVRRHCRYIIVSDCGADPGVAFDDLGNALRRIREDFGVDVELDVAPLRPDATGISRQHVAAGKVKYSETDTGILLYIKPSITGDEPPDIQQYRTRNLAFPHEATTDQFYDEAQWESYRRLGRHAAEHIFEFVRRDGVQKLSADWVFAEAARQWGPTPEGLEDRVLEMTRRFAAVDAELQHRQQQAMLRHVFPEMAETAGIKGLYTHGRADGVRVTPEVSGTSHAVRPAASSTLDAESAMAAELSLLLRVMQVMEDVWVACQLDRWWGHPLNLGWINLFARWATSPPFQFWWPLLSPMFSPGFRQFIQQRFPMRPDAVAGSGVPQKGWVEVVPGQKPHQSGLAAIWWEERSAQPVRWNTKVHPPYDCRFYQYLLELKRGESAVRIQVGLAAVTFNDQFAGWNSDDFFVPPSLWGAGIGGHFLRALLERVSEEASWCLVVVKAPPANQDHQVARDDRQAFVEHYKKVGFRETRAGRTAATVDAGLCDLLTYDEGRDTLLTLDLKQWRERLVPATAAARPSGAPSKG